VLFELATVQPGFTVDEPLAALGTALKLPAWEEPNRQRIEAALPLITTPA
jgi:glyoxalase family protein